MLEEVILEKGLRMLNNIGGRLEKKIIELPSDTEVKECIKELEKRFNFKSKVQYNYAKRTIIGYEHVKKHNHYKTKNLMLADINSGKKIYIKSYI